MVSKLAQPMLLADEAQEGLEDWGGVEGGCMANEDEFALCTG